MGRVQEINTSPDEIGKTIRLDLAIYRIPCGVSKTKYRRRGGCERRTKRLVTQLDGVRRPSPDVVTLRPMQDDAEERGFRADEVIE